MGYEADDPDSPAGLRRSADEFARGRQSLRDEIGRREQRHADLTARRAEAAARGDAAAVATLDRQLDEEAQAISSLGDSTISTAQAEVEMREVAARKEDEQYTPAGDAGGSDAPEGGDAGGDVDPGDGDDGLGDGWDADPWGGDPWGGDTWDPEAAAGEGDTDPGDAGWESDSDDGGWDDGGADDAWATG